MLKIMNSAMMPQDGFYIRRSISADLAKSLFEQYPKKWESYLGYEQTARVLSELLGVTIPVSRRDTTLEDGDVILVIKLPYRLQNPHEKAENTHGQKIEDYEFCRVDYYEKYHEN